MWGAWLEVYCGEEPATPGPQSAKAPGTTMQHHRRSQWMCAYKNLTLQSCCNILNHLERISSGQDVRKLRAGDLMSWATCRPHSAQRCPHSPECTAGTPMAAALRGSFW